LGNCRADIDNALQFFFPHTNSVNDLFVDSPIKLSQNYPNPALFTTTIPFSGPIGSEGELLLLDETGKIVSEIWTGKLVQEINHVEFGVANLKPGLYFCTLKTGLKSVVSKMIVR